MRRFKSKAGSALIWALAIALILSIVLIAGLGMVQRQQNQNVQQHIENQAYFSAMSVTQAVVGWLSGTNYDTLGGVTPGQEAQFEFINWITDPANRNTEKPLVSNALLDPARPELGTYSVFVKSSEDGSEITFRTVATHADATETVIGTMSKTSTADIIYGEKDPWSPIQVPPPIATVDGNTLIRPGMADVNISTLTGYTSGAPAGGSYRIPNGSTTTVTSGCNVLVASGNNSTVVINTTQVINLLVIKANTMVIPSNGTNLNIRNIVIESGGILNAANGAGYEGTENIYVMPGGRFINTSNSQWRVLANVWIYASEYPAPATSTPAWPAYTVSGNSAVPSWPDPGVGYQFPAYVDIGKVELGGNITIQKSTLTPDPSLGEIVSYPPMLVGLSDGTKFPPGRVVHIPSSYTSPIPDAVLAFVCTNSTRFMGTFDPVMVAGLSPSQRAQLDQLRISSYPFCPHFIAKAEDDIIFEDIIWGGSYSRG